MFIDLYFNLHATLRLAEHAAAAGEHAPTFSERHDSRGCTGALAWVADRGTYLMSTGLPGLRVDPADPTSANIVVYAEGWGPDSDRDALARTPVGGDDFVEHLHLTTTDTPDEPSLIDQLRSGTNQGHRYLVLRVGNQSFDLRLSRTGPDDAVPPDAGASRHPHQPTASDTRDPLSARDSRDGEAARRSTSSATDAQAEQQIDPAELDEPAPGTLAAPHAGLHLSHLHPDNLRIGSVGVFAGDWAWAPGPDGQMRLPIGFVGVLIDTWNGWAVFDCTRDVAEAIVADQQAQRDRYRDFLIESGRRPEDADRETDESIARMSMDTDAIVVDERVVTGDPEAVTRIEPDRDGRWMVMGGSWTWQAVDPHDCDRIVGDLPTAGQQQRYVVLPHTGMRVPHDRLAITAPQRPPTTETFTATLTLDGTAVGEIHRSADGTRLAGLSALYDRIDWTTYVAGCRHHGQPPSEAQVLDALISEYEHEEAARQCHTDGSLLTRLVDADGRTLRLRPVWPAPRSHTALTQLGTLLRDQEPHPEGQVWQRWDGHAWRHLATVAPTAGHHTPEDPSPRHVNSGQVIAYLIADALLDTLNRDQIGDRAADAGIPLDPHMPDDRIRAVVRDHHREQARQAAVPVDDLPTLPTAAALELGRLFTGGHTNAATAGSHEADDLSGHPPTDQP